MLKLEKEGLHMAIGMKSFEYRDESDKNNPKYIHTRRANLARK